jgi:endonuclease-3
MQKQRKLTAEYVLSRLEKLYEPPKSFLQWKTPFQLLIATILSARCTDAHVNTVTPRLFAKYDGPADYLKVSEQELQQDIHSCGTFRMKTKNIRGLCHKLLQEHEGEVPRTMEELVALPGVGRKTAAIILYAAFGKNEGIAVDTHVQRLSLRLGLTKARTPQKIELDLMPQTPRKKWGELNTLMISHGRAVCTARGRKCGACVFREKCPSSLTRGRRDLACA